MSVRVHKKSRFTAVSNDIIENRDISWEARGVLIYLLSKPEGWVVRNSDLIKQSPAGREKNAAILKELCQHKYMCRWKERSENGRFEWKSEVFESPKDLEKWVSEHPNTEVDHNVKTVSGSAVNGKSAKKRSNHNVKTVSGSAVNGPTVNGEPVPLVITDLTNTELVITDLTNTDQDPERRREEENGKIPIEVAPCEIVPEPEPVKPLGTAYPGQQTPLVNPTNLVGDNFSALGPIAPIDSAMPESRFKAPLMAGWDECKGLPGYEAFEAIYRGGLARLQAHYGDVSLAKSAWSQAWQGLHPPEWFWDGLNIYLEQRRESFAAKAGKSYACSGHKLLADGASRIKDAIAIQDARSEALSIGLDLTNPIAIERANSEISRKKNGQDWLEYRRQKELREAQGVA